jgi:hypothetical protein
MILFCLLLLICNSIGKPYNEHKLINKDFYANIHTDGILLNDKYNIKYEKMSENNKYKPIYFDKFNTYRDYSILTVSSEMDSINFVYEISDNKTNFMNDFKKIVKYEDNKLYVSIYVNDNYKDLNFQFSIDDNNIINNNSIEINNEFKIDIDEECLVDGEYNRIYLTKLNNKYRIHFPSFNHNLYYQFIISSIKEPTNNNFNRFIISILVVFGFFMYRRL